MIQHEFEGKVVSFDIYKLRFGVLSDTILSQNNVLTPTCWIADKPRIKSWLQFFITLYVKMYSFHYITELYLTCPIVEKMLLFAVVTFIELVSIGRANSLHNFRSIILIVAPVSIRVSRSLPFIVTTMLGFHVFGGVTGGIGCKY
uniref:Transmembrane protein n=1 Tax=Strongyloides venezuelensis TaxID=75913 RepID=A0A0K0FJT4_STRVS